MPTFRVLRQQDAFVEYVTEVEAESLRAAVDLAYTEDRRFKWERVNIAEYDACRVVGLDDSGKEIEAVARGRF
jgi:hypothetical protein